MADEYGEGETTPPETEDNSGLYFIEGSAFSTPPPPEGNFAPREISPDEWAVEFYELGIEEV